MAALLLCTSFGLGAMQSHPQLILKAVINNYPKDATIKVSGIVGDPVCVTTTNHTAVIDQAINSGSRVYFTIEGTPRGYQRYALWIQGEFAILAELEDSPVWNVLRKTGYSLREWNAELCASGSFCLR